jgi:carbamate kinase
LVHYSTQTQRCSPILNEEEINEIERRSDLNLIKYFASELRRIESGMSPCEVFNESIRRKLVKSGMLIHGRRDRWALSDECRKIMRIR